MTSIISVIQDASPIIVAIIAFVIILLIFRVVYYFQEKRLKIRLNIEKERWNRIREEKIRLRKTYENRLEIPSILLRMQDKAWDYTGRQLDINISKKKWENIAKDAKRIIPKFTILTLLLLPRAQWITRFVNVTKFLSSFLMDISALLKRHGYGALDIDKDQDYSTLYSQIKELEVGLPANICDAIEGNVVVGQMMSSMQVFDPSQPVLKKLNINPIFTNRFEYLLPATHAMLSRSRGNISSSIENWLTGD